MNTASQVAERHFGKRAIKSLSKRGIRIVSTQAYRVTYPNGSWAYETAYQLDPNGTGKVRSYQELTKIIEGAVA